MKKSLLVLSVSLLVFLFALGLVLAPTGAKQGKDVEKTRLVVIWSSGDPEVAHNACFMYTHIARTKGWFDEVALIIWGPSAKLLSEDASLQEEVKAMAADGVTIFACLACADSYGVTDKLRSLGVDVKYMGGPLTEMLQSGWKVLTF
jgi:hypothetical protein